jgi:hypothetical protein
VEIQEVKAVSPEEYHRNNEKLARLNDKSVALCCVSAYTKHFEYPTQNVVLPVPLTSLFNPFESIRIDSNQRQFGWER